MSIFKSVQTKKNIARMIWNTETHEDEAHLKMEELGQSLICLTV